MSHAITICLNSVKISFKLDMVNDRFFFFSHTTKAMVTHATVIVTTLSSSSLKTICVPVNPNSIGSQTIQNISKAVATGFYKNRSAIFMLNFVTIVLLKN